MLKVRRLRKSLRKTIDDWSRYCVVREIAETLTDAAKAITEHDPASYADADYRDAARLLTTIADIELAVGHVRHASDQQPLPEWHWGQHVDPNLVTLLSQPQSTPRWWALSILAFADKAERQGTRRNAVNLLRGIAIDYLALHGESRRSAQRLLADGYENQLCDLVTA